VIFLLGCQSGLIYHPSAYRHDHEQMLSDSLGVRLNFSTSQGRQTAYYIPPSLSSLEQQAVLWLCFGGNAALALDWVPFTGVWDDHYAYLLIDYPGYGESEGSPTPERIRENAREAYAALSRHLKVTTAELQPRTALLGHSLGAAAALMAAEDLGLRQAVLVSPFTTMTEMGREVLGWPLCLLNLHPYDNRQTLARLAAKPHAKVVIFHGSDDEVIPVCMGRELAALHSEQVQFYEVAGARHNDILTLIADRIGRVMAEMAGPAGQ
jgi:pimeloyl-ACP methyl ester carboxylesterase